MSAIIVFVSACEVSEINNTYIGAYGAASEEVQGPDSGGHETVNDPINNFTDEEYDFESVDRGGGGVATDFKVPLDPEYDWTVTQSWAEHCKYCTQKGYGSGQEDPNICNWTHSVLPSCKYGLDFSLPGENDKGKPVLATAEGTVKKAGWCSSWGNCVIVDHGNNVCSRYAHMQTNSITVNKGDGVCQGLILGKIGDTGSPGEFHLHFQFEKCTDATPISKFFTDGNGVPKCILGNDIYKDKNHEGKYTALVLTNKPKGACDVLGEFAKQNFSKGATLPVPGIKSVACGPLPNCPLITDCNANKKHTFSDDKSLTSSVRSAAQYLYGECALNGKDDGGLHQSDIITNAEGLKISMYLFGLVSDCGNSSAYVPFSDVKTTDWYYPLVVCGLQKGIVDNGALLFWANGSLSFQTAAEYLVKSAEKAGVITVKNPYTGNFSKIPSTHPAYKYVETLYAYAAIDTYLTAYYPETVLTRGQFVRMAANLSPCYCDNISCKGGCECNQVNFACSSSADGNDVGGGSSSSSGGSSSGGSGSGSSGGNSCTPSCSGKTCGADGCGSVCGSCSSGYECNASGLCQKICVPDCSGKTCGADGCGGICGNCTDGFYCTENQCKCLPNCNGKACGSDGCGGTCGSFRYMCGTAKGMKCNGPYDTKCPGGKCQKVYGCSSGYSCNASGQCVP